MTPQPNTTQAPFPNYLLAEDDRTFLKRPELRPVRLQLELLKPDLLLEEHSIVSTLVVFGGTQIVERLEAERRLKEYEAKLAMAAKEAEGILAAAKERAQRLLDENEQRLTAEAERIKGDATREIDHERRKAVQDIRNQTTELALMVAEKVVQRSLTDADQRKFADDALDALSKSYQR